MFIIQATDVTKLFGDYLKLWLSFSPSFMLVFKVGTYLRGALYLHLPIKLG
jgi:hypothetical protein